MAKVAAELVIQPALLYGSSRRQRRKGPTQTGRAACSREELEGENRRLPMAALRIAPARHQPAPGLILHSNRGAQFAGE